MSTRITLVLDDDILKALRRIQAKQIAKSEHSVSFSRVTNETLRKQLKL